MSFSLPRPLGRPHDLLVEPRTAPRLPGRRPGWLGPDPAPAIPATLRLLAAQGAPAEPWAADRDLLLAPYPAPGPPCAELVETLAALPPALPVLLYERDIAILPNLLVEGTAADDDGSPAAGLRVYRSAFRQQGRACGEALVLLPARRVRLLLRTSPWTTLEPGRGDSLQNRRFLIHALDQQRSLMLLARSGRPAPLSPAPRTLVLAPHFDDETILFGAAILAATAAGAETRIVWLTDGAAGLPGRPAAVATALRREEGAAAAARLGVTELSFLDAPDTRLRARGAPRLRLRRLLREFQPERILLPWWGDAHVDHYESFRLLRAALPRALGQVELALGGFWTPVPATHFVPVPVAVKDAALRCHASQLEIVDYARAVTGLDRWQARDLPDCAAAECYACMSAAAAFRAFRLSGADRRLYLRR